MKRLVSLVLVLLTLLVATAAVSADQPPGVAPAVFEGDECAVLYELSDPNSTYWGDSMWLYSNSATGHATFICKLELVEGPPVYYFTEYTWNNCDTTISLKGNKGMWTRQCFETWYP